MKLQTKQSLMFILDGMERELEKERARNEQLHRDVRDSDAKVADLVDRMNAIRDDVHHDS